MPKFLTDRQEIAKALNFRKYPVLRIDLSKPYYEGTEFYVGCKVRCLYPDRKYGEMYTQGNLQYDEGKYCISSNSCCLHSDFGYSDVIEDAEWAMTPTIHAGDTVVVVEDWSEKRQCRVRMMKAGDRIEPFCMTAVRLYDID